MQKVTFTLRVLTHLFLSGAEQTNTEIRTPSFRGGMRYWYRAMISGLLENRPGALEILKKSERQVFGAIDSGSTVQIRILDTPLDANASLMMERTGRGYLWWSVMNSRRPCFLPDTQFKVELAVRGDEGSRQEAFQQAISAFWLLTNLGGVGSRARRCAGSLMVTNVTGNTFGLPFTFPNTVASLQRMLTIGILQSRKLYDSNGKINEAEAHHDTLSPKNSKIWILLNKGQPWGNATQALYDIGESLQYYRQNDMPNLQDRKIFGIPVMHLIYENGRRKSLPTRIVGGGSQVSRVASPLHLRLSAIQTDQGKRYVCIATLFKTKWENMSEQEFALYSHIERWREIEFPSALEVQL